MANVLGFDNEKYLKEQYEKILERVQSFDNKLYLEFGGKIMFDYHAARILPGFDPNVKMRLLQKFKEKADLIMSSTLATSNVASCGPTSALPMTLTYCGRSMTSTAGGSRLQPL
jgi:uncharacterized protein (UPF0371 family)